MEYYKELFFSKKKHSYDLYEINFCISDDSVVRYNNTPAFGFKLVGVSSLLDPVTGYVFHPENSCVFKELIIKRNFLKNGICVCPIIFEYIKDGSFNAHIYDDVKDDLIEVSVQDKVSLSESKPGTILRSVDDESYYIYMGMVGQYYITGRGKGNVRKKHLVLKTDNFNEYDESTVLIVHHFSYVDFTKDKNKSYFKVKDIAPENLKIKYYSFGNDIISVGDYIDNDKFQVYDFQQKYPYLLLNGRIKIIFDKDDISMTRNKVKLRYEYVGETGLSLNYSFTYSSFDSKVKKLFNTTVKSEIQTTDFHAVDFEKHNYVVEIDGEKYLISNRRLTEIDCYYPHFKSSVNLFQTYRHNADFLLYKMDDSSVMDTKTYQTISKRTIERRTSPDWSKKVKIYKVEYVLNGKHHFNLFSKPSEKIENEDVIINDIEVFDFIREHGGISINIFGED